MPASTRPVHSSRVDETPLFDRSVPLTLEAPASGGKGAAADGIMASLRRALRDVRPGSAAVRRSR